MINLTLFDESIAICFESHIVVYNFESDKLMFDTFKPGKSIYKLPSHDIYLFKAAEGLEIYDMKGPAKLRMEVQQGMV